MVHRALSDKMYLSLGLLSPLLTFCFREFPWVKSDKSFLKSLNLTNFLKALNSTHSLTSNLLPGEVSKSVVSDQTLSVR